MPIRLLDGVLPWVNSDRAVTINDITAEYGPASITFGDPDPRDPKTLGYATQDTEAPFLVFHFEAAEPTADASSVEGRHPACRSHRLQIRVHGAWQGAGAQVRV